MKIFYGNADDAGCGFYRCFLPAQVLGHRGHMTSVSPPGTRASLINNEDIAVFQRHYRPLTQRLILQKKRSGIKTTFELDDDLWAIASDNPAFPVYDSQSVGKREYEFQLKNNDKNIRFLKPLTVMRDIIRMVDAVTVSTVPLAKRLGQWNKKVYVAPNGVIPVAKQEPLGDMPIIRIGWSGSMHHMEDLKPAASALKRLMREDSRIHMVIIGWVHPFFQEEDFRNRIEVYPWIKNVHGHSIRSAIVPVHIGIAPLEYNEFNLAKCIDAGTLITTRNRGIVTASELIVGENVLNGDNWVEIRAKEISQERQGVLITTEMGYQIKLTPEHRMMVNGEWTTADKISIGDTMALSPEKSCEIPGYQMCPWPADGRQAKNKAEDYAFASSEDSPVVCMSERWGRVLGAFVGDGSVGGKGRIEISCDGIDEDWIELLMSDFRAIGFNPTTETHKMFDGKVLRRRGVRVHSAHFGRFLKSIGLAEVKPNGNLRRIATIPDFIWNSKRTVISEFLSAYFEADGTCSKSGTSVEALSKNEDLIRGIQRLLLLFGIQAIVRPRTYSDQNGRKGTYWHLRMNRASSDIFYKEIGFKSKRKSGSLREIYSKPHSNAYKPIAWEDKVASIEGCTVTPVDIQVDGSVFTAAGFVSHNSNLKLLEYGINTTCAIAQDIYPYCTTIENQREGLLVKKHDESSWYEAIKWAIENPVERRDMARRLRDLVYDKYTIDKVIIKHEEIYEKILKDKFNPRVPKKIYPLDITDSRDRFGDMIYREGGGKIELPQPQQRVNG